MTRTVFKLCLSVVLVVALLLPVTGCIKIVQPEGKQATGDQSGPAAPPPPEKPPGSQAGATTPGGQPTPTPPPTQPQPGAVANWTGTWQCATWGKLYLTQTGTQVTGWYDWDNGKVSAYATGTTLVGTWSEAPTFNPPDDSGDFQFNLSADSTSFTGQWRYGTSGDWDGSWGCTRVSSATPPNQPSPPTQQAAPTQQQPTPLANWTGTWQCGQDKLYLSQTGNQVTGWRSDAQDIKLEAYATGNTLVGTWTPSSQTTAEWQLTMSANGNTFNGLQRSGPSGSWTGGWYCSRISSDPPPSKPTPVPASNWSGSWLCGSWGRLNLSQSGSTVTGTYTYQGGKFTGYATGNTLVGTWSEQPTYNPPDDAGDVQFNMSADSNSFTGYWRYGSSGAWAGTWNGQRDQ